MRHYLFSAAGTWSVIQQGMNADNRYARRYHWMSDTITDFVSEPHQAICCDKKRKSLNLVAHESEKNRLTTTSLSREKPERILTELTKAEELLLPRHHDIKPPYINKKRLEKILLQTHERQPETFEALLGMVGMGPKTIRALSLISELVYGEPPSFRDPARYSFSHGGKDGHPFPVDRETYDFSIHFLRECINKIHIHASEKKQAFSRLSQFGVAS